MLPVKIMSAIESIPGLHELGSELKQSLHEFILAGGEPARKAADVLHGTWLGHPAHPPMTDVVVGGWSMGAIFDVLATVTGNPVFEQVADRCTEAGAVAAIPTALTGLVEYSTVQQPAVSAATAHGALNSLALPFYLWSIRERRRGNRERAVCLALSAYFVMFSSAWLGGHLAFAKKVGVDHGQSFDGPTEWTDVLDAGELELRQPRKVDLGGKSVLVYRSNGRVYAIDGVCSHAGGPLEEGTFDECTVQCPWHDSVFDLRNGRIVHGPATHPQAAFDARIRNGRVEVRLQRG